MPSSLARTALVVSALVVLSACTTTDPATAPSPSGSGGTTTATTGGAGASATAAPLDTPSPEPSFATDPAYSVAPPEEGEGPAAVTVHLTRAGTVLKVVMAAAVVEGITESGGTCTLTLSDGTTTRTATGPAAPSASSTDCGEGLEVSTKDLSAGTWTAQIAYSSDLYAGVSDTMEVVVP